MSKTNIEWTAGPNGEKGRVWNPVTGCTKVSQGCKNCYAEGVANRFWAKQYPPVLVSPLPDHTRAGIESSAGTAAAAAIEEAPGHRPRRFTDVQTHKDRLLEPLKWRKPARIFVNSMSDLFHADVPVEFIDQVFGVMSLCPQHTFLVLTKRPERMRNYFDPEWDTQARIEEAADWQRENIPTPLGYEVSPTFQRAAAALGTMPWPYPNVHLGVSVENQQTADERITLLLQTPAAIRWVSYEPALGPVDFAAFLNDEGDEVECCGEPLCEHCDGTGAAWELKPALDWIVVGGESGAGARPFDVAWARQTVGQCRAAGVAVFVKQLGSHVIDRNDAGFDGDPEDSWTPTTRYEELTDKGWQGDPVRIRLRSRKGGDMSEWPTDLRVREFPEVRA